jgi:hypothetical protein
MTPRGRRDLFWQACAACLLVLLLVVGAVTARYRCRKELPCLCR